MTEFVEFKWDDNNVRCILDTPLDVILARITIDEAGHDKVEIQSADCHYTELDTYLENNSARMTGRYLERHRSNFTY